MIEEILPEAVVAVATRGELAVDLFPEEEAKIEKAVEGRRREFTTTRACARSALSKLALPEMAIATGKRGEPLWPTGVVGSLTHCEGYRAAAVARTADFRTVGIDAEQHAPLPDGILDTIARSEEIPRLRELAHHDPATHWDRLLFSAKESVYKAWFPLANAWSPSTWWLDFEEATLTIDPENRTFSARLLVPGPQMDGIGVTGFSGRWLVAGGIVVTAIAVPAG